MTANAARSLLLGLSMFALVGGGAQAQLFGQPQQRGGDESEVIQRMGRLENQIRQLTGMVEELQFRNNQLEQQLKRMQQDTDYRFQEMGPQGRTGQRSQGGAGSPPPGPPPLTRSPAPGPGPVMNTPPDTPPPAGQRRGDVFDPSAAPGAPGAPRTLGSMPGGSPDAGDQRRAPGMPLDLGSSAGAGSPPLPPGSGAGFPSAPAGKGAPATGAPVGQQQAVLAPSGSARDEYDLAYGAVQRRDYELAVEGFRVFLANHGTSREPEVQRLAPEAHYWMGEAQFQLKQYNDSAETFLKISTEYPNAVKAPDALLRLGQSLAALGERETACASFGHVLTKYPRATPNVKRAVEQEQKRVRC